MLNWVDFIIAIFMVGAAIGEMKRGFGKAIFDFAALLLAMKAAYLLRELLAGSIKISLKQPTNDAFVFAASFVIVGGVLLYLGKLVYDTTLLSAEFFDPLLGGIFGIGVGLILMHAFVRTIALSAGPHHVPLAISSSALGAEFLNFEGYHRLMHFLYNFHREE